MKEKYVGTDIQAVIAGIKEELQAKGKSLKAVYFVACGGSEASIAAGKDMLGTGGRKIQQQPVCARYAEDAGRQLHRGLLHPKGNGGDH